MLMRTFRRKIVFQYKVCYLLGKRYNSCVVYFIKTAILCGQEQRQNMQFSYLEVINTENKHKKMMWVGAMMMPTSTK